MARPASRSENQLLAALTGVGFERLRRDLEPIALPLAEPVYESGVMTQELMANMLGARREGVTEAAGGLQERGLIRYSRGRVTMLDRAGVEKCVCECYSVVKREYDRLLT